MRQNDIFRPRPTDVASSAELDDKVSLHIGSTQVLFDAARGDSDVTAALAFLDELEFQASRTAQWLRRRSGELRLDRELDTVPAAAAADASEPPGREVETVDLPADPPAPHDAGLEPQPAPQPAKAEPSPLRLRGYANDPAGRS